MGDRLSIAAQRALSAFRGKPKVYAIDARAHDAAEKLSKAELDRRHKRQVAAQMKAHHQARRFWAAAVARGLTRDELAVEMGVDRATVDIACEKFRLEPVEDLVLPAPKPKPSRVKGSIGRRADPALRARYEAHVANGRTIREIATAERVSYGTARCNLVRFGLSAARDQNLGGNRRRRTTG